ncbi:hypothetical protein F4780DRAFT_783496 [Xylariomycetidae sp. FL0641]|nr:hypothetical protein F4780DRAFT_783496 [Xylariomycetidae sp. FL0641]
MDSSSEKKSRSMTGVTSRSTRTFLGRSLTRRDTAGSISDEQEGPKGPMGLRTVYEPSGDALADLILVHGLNGGSQSTWTKGNESTFWPQEWLSQDDAFRDVQIHTFGYMSGINRESILNVHDFADDLLNRVYNSPTVAAKGPAPIIFVGHSMGGLVVKKAFISASQIPEYQSLARRVRAMFFLATPHQGAGVAELLSRVLALAPGSRPFVNDLSPQSGMLQSINEEFPRYSQELQLFSFYETRPMYYGLGKGLIVEKPNAVMNYTNERRTYLDANHRDVARFSTPAEPTYISVRNALATTVESLRASLHSSRQDVEHHEMQALSKFLGVSAAPEDDLMTNDSLKLSGSCQWLTQGDYFQQWRDAMMSKTLWLRGRPGTGKSVLASHVVNHLRALSLDSCYFFFAENDKGKDTVNAFLRSMAWQMAVIHPEIFSLISQVTNNWKDNPIDKVDHSPVWRRIFAAGILKARLKKPQYWVIDALDECRNGAELMSFLRRAQEMWPLCVLVTSRTGVESYITSSNPSMEVISETILEENKSDIRAFLSANLQNLPGATVKARQSLADRILRNSSGCFLWVSLVLKELRQVHTSAEISQVLDSNPSDMTALYRRIVDEMAHAKFGKDLAKAILKWTTCAFRPLSVEEMHYAIEKDIEDSIDSVGKSISTCCSNLVYIDRARKVQPIHATAREFLTRKDISSEFSIDRAVSHKRLALVCIQALCGGQGGPRRGSRTRRSTLNETATRVDSPLHDYASTYLFQHVLQASSTDNEIFVKLAEFLGSHEVLAWIERLSANSDLQRIYQAGKNCTNMVLRRVQHSPPIGIQKQVAMVERWGTDLLRLVNKFGKQLNQCPSSIHHLIPPFCPSESALRRQFVNPYRGLTVRGHVPKTWDDCLCTINYSRASKPMQVATTDKRIALALSNGNVSVYDNATLLETHSLLHGEPVWSLVFGETPNILATGGAKHVRVWNLDTSTQTLSFKVGAVCMAMTFMENDDLLVVATKKSLVYWDLASNADSSEPIDWTRDLREGDPQLQLKRPTLAAFSLEQGLLAIVYRGEDILLWDLAADQIADMYEKDIGSDGSSVHRPNDGSTTVWAIAFSSTVDVNLLVAAYADGDVMVYDTDRRTSRGCLDGVNAQTIACSPDGRTLATADSHGNINLFDLNTLKFIYRIRFDTDALRTKKLAFTSDNLRLLDIRGHQLRVWDPTVLLRQEFEDENSDTISCSTIPVEVDYATSEACQITSIACPRSASVVLAGKEDGSVHVYNITGEPQGQELFIQTSNCAITSVYFDEELGLVSCCDVASRVTSRRVFTTPEGTWASGNVVLDQGHQVPVTQVIASGKYHRVLISTVRRDEFWHVDPSSPERQITHLEGSPRPRWLASPMNSDVLLHFEGDAAVFYRWEDLSRVRSVNLSSNRSIPIAVESILPFQHPQYFATVQMDPTSDGTSSSSLCYHLWDLRDFIFQPPTFSSASSTPTRPEAAPVSPSLDFAHLGVKVESIVGVANERAVFLGADNWVCSAEIGMPASPRPVGAVTEEDLSDDSAAVRHFFIPDEWAGLRVLIEVRRSGEIVFVKRADLAVLRGGLEITDKGIFNSRPRGSAARTALLPRRPAAAEQRHISV